MVSQGACNSINIVEKDYLILKALKNVLLSL